MAKEQPAADTSEKKGDNTVLSGAGMSADTSVGVSAVPLGLIRDSNVRDRSDETDDEEGDDDDAVSPRGDGGWTVADTSR